MGAVLRDSTIRRARGRKEKRGPDETGRKETRPSAVPPLLDYTTHRRYSPWTVDHRVEVLKRAGRREAESKERSRPATRPKKAARRRRGGFRGGELEQKKMAEEDIFSESMCQRDSKGDGEEKEAGGLTDRREFGKESPCFWLLDCWLFLVC